MASLKEIKGRIASVRSTQKITSAMKMVASAKLHRAQSAIAGMLPYEQKLSSMLTMFLGGESEVTSPFAENRPVQKVIFVVFSSNSSLCGAYNSNVFKQLKQAMEQYKHLPNENILIYPIGKKIAQSVEKAGYRTIGNHFEELAEKPSYEETNRIASDLMQQFLAHKVDRIELLYHHLKSTASQVIVHKNFLPISIEEMQKASATPVQIPDYIVEPSREELLTTLLPQAISFSLFTALLDSNASEHAARMMAMQIATDNAEDLLQELTILYNKSRQQAITSELLDIIGGSMK